MGISRVICFKHAHLFQGLLDICVRTRTNPGPDGAVATRRRISSVTISLTDGTSAVTVAAGVTARRITTRFTAGFRITPGHIDLTARVVVDTSNVAV